MEKHNPMNVKKRNRILICVTLIIVLCLMSFGVLNWCRGFSKEQAKEIAVSYYLSLTEDERTDQCNVSLREDMFKYYVEFTKKEKSDLTLDGEITVEISKFTKKVTGWTFI